MSSHRKKGKSRVYLSGIAGTGMSSLAGLFCQSGHDVYGSDAHFYPPVDRILSEMKVKTFQGFDPSHIPSDVDLCVIGNVISRGNPEAEYILNRGLKFDSMAGALYDHFIRGNRSVVVAGTHGKTTIASMVAHLLDRGGLNPGFFIGGKPLDFQRNYQVGSGTYFVTEGDEYETSFFDRSSKFLKYFPHYLILSAMEYDHIDFFPTSESYLKSFQNLVNQVPSEGVIICNSDFPMNVQALERAFSPVITYGRERGDYLIESIGVEKGRYRFVLKNRSRRMEYECSVPGRHNIWNCCAAIILGLHLGLGEKLIQEAMGGFQGVERRMRTIRENSRTLFIEDFAHHPTSVASLLRSLREFYPGKKLIALFEPRSWSLRKNVFQDRLVSSLTLADEVGIKEVFQKEKLKPDEVLDVDYICAELGRMGRPARIFEDYEDIRDFINSLDMSRDQLVVLISNGDFGGLPAFVRNMVGVEK